MDQDDSELLTELAVLSSNVTTLVVGLADGSLPAEAQADYGRWLTAVGEVLVRDAEAGGEEF